MKTSIIISGIVALLFNTNTKAANGFKTLEFNQQEVTTASVDKQQPDSLWVTANQEFSKENNGNEEVVFNPASVIKTAYTKPVEEVVNENKLITEAKETKAQPLSIATTLQDRIAENNAIIESTTTNEVYALDFQRINHSPNANKVPNQNLALTVDLKL